MSYTKISVLVPTRHRTEFVKKLLQSCAETVKNPAQAELVFRIDSDDAESAELLANYRWPVIVGPRREGYKSLPAFYNEMVKQATGDLFVCGNDDIIFCTPDWPRLIIEEADKYPDGIFDIGVRTGLNDENFPFSIVSRQLVERLGKINDERLLFSDIFLRDVAKHFKRAISLPSVIFYHDWTGYTDDATRRDASKHEFAEVWEKAPGHWTEAYKKLHDMAVSEAIAKLEPAMKRTELNQPAS